MLLLHFFSKLYTSVLSAKKKKMHVKQLEIMSVYCNYLSLNLRCISFKTIIFQKTARKGFFHVPNETLHVSSWISQFALILNQPPDGCGFGPTIQLTLWACGGGRQKSSREIKRKQSHTKVFNILSKAVSIKFCYYINHFVHYNCFTLATVMETENISVMI